MNEIEILVLFGLVKRKGVFITLSFILFLTFPFILVVTFPVIFRCQVKLTNKLRCLNFIVGRNHLSRQ